MTLLIFVVRVRLSPGSIQLIFTAACARGLARHDQVKIGVLLVANPGHPRNLGPVVGVVTLGALTIEEDPRRLRQGLVTYGVLCKEGGSLKKASQGHNGEDNVLAAHT